MAELNSFLTSIADAIRSKKGTTEKINASNFASEIKSISSGGGSEIEIVEELPTNPEEDVIYQVNEVSDIDVLGWLGEPYIPTNLEQFIINFGATPDLYYYVVDSLPNSPNISNLQTFSPAHIYIYNDIPYIYGNAGYGNMWLDVATLFTSFGYPVENKGYVSSIVNINEPGIFVTYKLGRQGVYKRKFDTLIYENDWNDYKKIFDKTIDKYSNSVITSIQGYTFINCESLTNVNLPNVTEIPSYTFANCESLTNVNLPNVTKISSWAFQDCKSLTNIDLPNVTEIGYDSFYRCESLTNIDLPNLTTIGGFSFYYCKSLIKIVLPNVTEIGEKAFYLCESLKTIDLSSVTKIYSWAFQDCKSLTNIILRKNAICNLYQEVFDGCSSLTNIYVPDDLVDSYKTTSGTGWSSYAEKIKPLSEYVEV